MAVRLALLTFYCCASFRSSGKWGAGAAGENGVGSGLIPRARTVKHCCVNTANLRLTPIAPPSLTSTINCPHIFLMASLK